jgi:hypothetical protein
MLKHQVNDFLNRHSEFFKFFVWFCLGFTCVSLLNQNAIAAAIGLAPVIILYAIAYWILN